MLLCRNQQQRIATESAEEREGRLQLLRRNQEQRIASESGEEREARLQQVRRNQSFCRVHRGEACLHKRTVQSKMSKFHSEMAARMARANTDIVCSLPLAKNAMHSPTSSIIGEQKRANLVVRSSGFFYYIIM